jgi:glucosamine-6-phosphate deaminase
MHLMDPGARTESVTGSGARGPFEGRGPSSSPTASSSRERIPTVVINDADALAIAVAHRIAHVIRAREAQGRGTVLGLATGSTPLGVYRELVRLHREEGLSFRNVTTFNLDEYVPMDPGNRHSYHRFMWEQLFAAVDIDPTHVHLPRGDLPRAEIAAACEAYEEAIREAGGIDLQILVWWTLVWVPVGFLMTGLQYLLTAIKNLIEEDTYLSTSVQDGYEEQ